ncbi:MAG: hypothetical protein AAF957_05700 [Planctomycetota bacterium]
MDKVILKSGRVRHEENRAGRHTTAVARGEQPEVRLVEVDGAVRAIEVRCACGETVTVEVDVAPGIAPGGAS